MSCRTPAPMALRDHMQCGPIYRYAETKSEFDAALSAAAAKGQAHLCMHSRPVHRRRRVYAHPPRARARTNTYAYVASECYVWGIPVASASETGHHPRVSICMLIPNRPSSSTSPPRGAGRASRSAERVFFSTSWRMPSANAEDPCRSEGTQRRVYPGLFQRCPLIRSSPRRSPLVCPEKLSKVDPRSGPIFEALASEFPNVRSSALYLEAL